jgi:hypothetical protein
MQTVVSGEIIGIPLTTFSQADYPIELERMYDTATGQTLTRTNDFIGTITYSGTTDIEEDDLVFVSITRQDEGKLFITEQLLTVTSTPTAGSFNVAALEPETMPPSGKVSYYKEFSTTPKDVTFGLQPSGGTLAEFKIRANSQGNGKVFIGEILKTYLPEFVAPKDYETEFLEPNFKTIEILFNGAEGNEINLVYGAKFLNPAPSTKNVFDRDLILFQEQLIGYGFSNLKRIFVSDYEIGLNEYSVFGQTSYFNLYPAIPCRKKIYLSANYGLLPDGELIDVSVPVLAFINRRGRYEYIRFTGSNVNKYNVQEARLKQDYAGTITNADTGLIYEGIELTLADDNENTDFPYLIDKLELQRCKALLMESPKAWLLVNGELQQALEVRVKRESVRFATSFDKSRDNFTAQCEVIVCQPLGNPQY